MVVQAQSVDLSNCDREPIRIIGSVQPAGMLLCLSDSDWNVLQLSENAAASIGLKPTELVGKTLREFLSAEDSKRLSSYLEGIADRSGGSVRLTLPDGNEYTAEAHVQHGNQIILEMEPAGESSADPVAMAKLLSGPVDLIEQTTDVKELLDLIAKQVHTHTGYDRIKIYKFDPQWNGEVVSEYLTGGELPSYKGHWFPASDIPKPAREMFTKNWIRIIPDVSYTPVPVVPADNPITKEPLDMIMAVFRAVSPIHIEYLHNMRVGASMSISIIVRGQLWGLIACHHKTPKAVPHTVRATCQLLGKLLSVRLGALQEQEANKQLHLHRGLLSMVRASIANQENVAAGVVASAEALSAALDLDGCVVVSNQDSLTIGETLPQENIARLVEWLESQPENIFYTSEAGKELPVNLGNKSICGVCAVRVSSPQKLTVIGLRKEVVQKITWGGDPTKPMEAEGNTMRLHPRKSFESFVQTVMGQSLPWKDSDVSFLKQLSETLVSSITQKEYQFSAEALSLSKERDDVVSGLAHDLKAPLIAAIKTSQALAAGRFGTMEGLPKEMVRLMVESQQELLGRLESMLSIYRQEVMGISLLSKQLHLKDLVHKTVDRLRFSFAAKQLTPSVKAENVTVLGDEDAITRVIENLLSNAIKFSPEESDVTITCREEDGQAVLCVTDCGPGIGDGEKGSLFSRFSQGEAGKSKDGGHGLGLYLTRRIVETHGGKVTCLSTAGSGATFEVRLPLYREDAVGARTAG